jgi:hypothetical protein
MACNNGAAQIQQAWVAHYNNGITNGTNQAVKMALDSSGNIYVTGFSQNANTNLGYVTIKYAPNGNQLWAARYDSTNSPMATPSGLVLDNSNNVIITGNALTVKYDTNGNQVWTASYPGAALAVDTNGNVAVTGFGTSFGTVKLSPAGSNLWEQTYASSCGPGAGQAIIADPSGSYYVVGSYPYFCEEGVSYYELLIIKYSGNGNQIWSAYFNQGSFTAAQVESAALDYRGNIDLLVDFSPDNPGSKFNIFDYTPGGTLAWAAYPISQWGYRQGHCLAIGPSNAVFATGQVTTSLTLAQDLTVALDTNGVGLWTNLYPSIMSATGTYSGMAITVDSGNNSYITGYSFNTNSSNNIITIKYDPNGNQIWLQRYTSPGNGNAAGNAIAVDKSGNVYVAGYDTTTAGGTEMVLIKYSPVTLQRKPDGTVLLETQGSPGESFDIEASADLLNWLDLGTVLADTNGLMQFDDTNAPNFPSRFYYTNPQ